MRRKPKIYGNPISFQIQTSELNSRIDLSFRNPKSDNWFDNESVVAYKCVETFFMGDQMLQLSAEPPVICLSSVWYICVVWLWFDSRPTGYWALKSSIPSTSSSLVKSLPSFTKYRRCLLQVKLNFNSIVIIVMLSLIIDDLISI